jgi:hypothetical protein
MIYTFKNTPMAPAFGNPGTFVGVSGPTITIRESEENAD